MRESIQLYRLDGRIHEVYAVAGEFGLKYEKSSELNVKGTPVRAVKID